MGEWAEVVIEVVVGNWQCMSVGFLTFRMYVCFSDLVTCLL
jgi:hypothetical protein